MAGLKSPALSMSLIILALSSWMIICRLSFPVNASGTPTPTPTPWPHQFHALLWQNYSGSLSMIDLWYDWPNGRNFNIVRPQLGGTDTIVYDLEWNNGTSFFYTLPDDHPSSRNYSCRVVLFEVGILRPDWLVDGSNYLGQRYVDGFLCNVWEKVDFIWYYEDVVTKKPVQWIFYTGRSTLYPIP